MAEKKKYRRAKKNDILIPHVAEDVGERAPQEELSAQAQRANDAVDAIIRDLFGKQHKKQGAAVATLQPTEEGAAQEMEDTDASVTPKEESGVLTQEENTPLSADGAHTHTVSDEEVIVFV